MGEDEDAHRPGGLDEAGGGDRLAGGGRVAEAVAADGARVVLGRAPRRSSSSPSASPPPRAPRPPPRPASGRAVLDAVPVAVLRSRPPLVAGDQLGEHARERVDLVAAELGARGEARRLVREHALEAEHERVADLPAGEGARRPASISASASSSARRRARPSASTSAGSSSGWRNASPAQASARRADAVKASVSSDADGRMLYRFLHGRSAAALPASQRVCASKTRAALE